MIVAQSQTRHCFLTPLKDGGSRSKPQVLFRCKLSKSHHNPTSELADSVAERFVFIMHSLKENSSCSWYHKSTFLMSCRNSVCSDWFPYCLYYFLHLQTSSYYQPTKAVPLTTYRSARVWYLNIALSY